MEMRSFFMSSIFFFIFLCTPIAHARNFNAEKGETGDVSSSSFILPEPKPEVESEGGSLYTWPAENQALSQANARMAILDLAPQGLFLPMYGDLHTLCYVTHGRAIAGLIHRSGMPTNIRYVAVGDLLAVPSGWTSWLLNNARIPFRIVCAANALQEQDCHSFYLAGGNGILRGFTDETLAQAFDLEEDEVRRAFWSQNSTAIIKVENMEQNGDGLMESAERNVVTGDYAVNMHLIRSDVEERGGWITHVSANKMKVLEEMEMGAMLVTLRRGAMLGPQWMNIEGQVLYVTKGDGRVEVTSDDGNFLLNETLREENAFVVPPLHPHVVVAGERGMELICIHVSREAVVTSRLAGSTSVLRAIPLDILSASLNSTSEIAEQVQNSRPDEDFIFSA